MSDRYQGLGLALLVSLGVVVGGATLGMANPVQPAIAQATVDEAQQAFDEGDTLFVKQDAISLRGAIEQFEKALRLSRQNNNQNLQVLALGALGRIYIDLGNTRKALELYTQALPLAHALGNQSNEASILSNTASAYADLDDRQKALELYTQALQIERTIRDRSAQAVTLSQIGGLYSVLSEKKEALNFYAQALLIFRAVADRSGEATTLTKMGVVYSTLCENLDEKKKALELHNQALQIFRSVKKRSMEATTLNNIGSVYFALGELQKALEFYSQALIILRPMGNRSREAATLSNFGLVYYHLGEKQKALEFYNQALALWRSGRDRRGESSTLNNLSNIYDDLGENQKALELYNQALLISRAVGDRFGEATILNNIGSIQLNLDNKKTALEFYNQALLIHRTAGNRIGEASSLNGIGSVYAALDEKQTAFEFAHQALPLYRAVGNQLGEVITLSNMAKANKALNELTLSLQNINSAIDLIETLRGELKNDALKTSYFKSVQKYYQFKIDLLMQLHRQQPTKGYDIAALETADQSRGRVLRELLIQSNAKLYTNIAPDLLKREQTLNQTIDAQEKQLIQRSEQPNANTQALKDSISKLYADRDDLKNTIRAKSPAYANLQYPKPAKLADLQQQLDPDTVMLQYSLGERESYLWVISNTGMKSYILPKQSDIEKTATAFLSEVINQSPLDRSASLLTQQILKPAAEQIKGKRLVIIPDGILHKVPFAALTLPNLAPYTPLLTQHEITNLPSASTIGILRTTVATKPRAKKTIALLADPVFNKSDTRLTGKTIQESQDFDMGDPLDKIAKRRIGRGMNFDRLPGTATEATGILSLVPDERDRTTAFGFDANYNWVTSPTLSQYRYIHLATHGFFDGEKPAFSSIVLSGYDSQGRDRKSYLRLPELFNLNLSAELVILSACQTGLGNEVPGEGSVGMTRGLMYAGALRVSTTLWSVNDNATAELMQDFYKNLWQSKKSHAASLRAAQLKLWNEGKAPYLWAAFTLQGEWRD